MNIRTRVRKITATLIITGMCNLSLGLPMAHAGLISTEAALSASQLNADKIKLKELLARAEVREQLTSLGADPAEVDKRVDSLTPKELSALHDRIDKLPAGGDLVGAVVFIFLVLLITDILGFTDVFTFVKKHR